MKLNFHALTDVGRKRTENQDSYGILEDKDVFVVCDGMGGGAAGDFASRAAVQVLLKAFEKLKPADLEKVVSETAHYGEPSRQMFASIRLANRALSNLAEKYPKLKGMGTTIVACLVDKERNLLHIFHVGDSRLYRLRGEEMELLTYDHSKVNELIELGKMTETEAKHSEIQSMITRALGTQPLVRIDYKVVPIQEGDCFMMCTDGLNGEIEDAQIRDIFLTYQTPLSQLCKQLINAANAAGGRDNTTVVAFRATELTAPGTKTEPLIQDTGIIYTVDSETPEETEAENSILRTLIRAAGVKLPKSAYDRNIATNPVVIGMMSALVLVAVVLLISKISAMKPVRHQEKATVNVLNKLCGFSVTARTPNPDQYRSYKASDDPIMRMQLIQDWYKDAAVNTVPLDGVAVSIENNMVIISSGVTAGKAFDAPLAPGSYTIKLTLANYKVITDKMESGAEVRQSAEYAAALKPVVVIMLPE